MKWFYTYLMFLILILFCVGNVCAVDSNNIDSESFILSDSDDMINITSNIINKNYNSNNVQTINDYYNYTLNQYENNFTKQNNHLSKLISENPVDKDYAIKTNYTVYNSNNPVDNKFIVNYNGSIYNNSILLFNNSNSINNHVKTNPTKNITGYYNISEMLSNCSCGTLLKESMDKSIIDNKEKVNLLVNVFKKSNKNNKIDNITIHSLLEDLFKNGMFINLNSTIDCIDYVINYDIVQLRNCLITMKKCLVEFNESDEINMSDIDNNKNLKLLMGQLEQKVTKLALLGAYTTILDNYFKTNSITKLNNKTLVKQSTGENNLSSMIKKITYMVGYLNILKQYLITINNNLKDINNIILLNK